MTAPAPRLTPTIRSVHWATASQDYATLTTAPAEVGDVLLAFRAADWDTAAELTAPYGTAGTWRYLRLADRGTNATTLQAYDRQVTARGAQRVTVNYATDCDVALIVVVFDGSTLDPNWYHAVNSTTGGATRNHAAASVSPSSPSTLLITAHATSDSGNSTRTVARYTAPAGMSSVLRQGSSPIAADTVSSDEWISLGVFSQALGEPAATGTRTATSSVTRPFAAVTLAFRGAVVPVPVILETPERARSRTTVAAGEFLVTGTTYDTDPARQRITVHTGELTHEGDLPAVQVRPTAPDTHLERVLERHVPARWGVGVAETVMDNMTGARMRVRWTVAGGELAWRAVTPLAEQRPRVTTRPRKRLRFLAQRALSREWLTSDLGLTDAVITWRLNGACEITGKVAAGELRRDGLDEWGCFIHAELDGSIRASGLLMPFAYGGPKVEIVASGVSRYLHGLSYDADFTLRGETGVVGQQLDPLDVVRHCWAHAQSYPDGQLGVVLSATRSTVRIGEPERDVSITTEAGETAEFTAGPYLLKWWEDTDLGKVVDDLAKSTPFDYREQPYWNSDRSDVVQFVELGWPRVGRARDDLVFAQGENLTRALTPVENDDRFATEVMVLGKGEGSARIRGRFGARVSGRVRRTGWVELKDCSTTSMATAHARAEWPRRQGFLSFDEVAVKTTHINAPLGAYAVGDDVPVRARVEGFGDVLLRHRVMELAYTPNASELVAKTARSDTFSYGSSAATT